MLGFIIIAHSPLASALKAVAAHAFPECIQSLEALDVPPDMPPEEIEARARVMIERVAKPDALIFTDVFGATPSNTTRNLIDGTHVKLIAGVNVPMLYRSLGHANEPLDAVMTRALVGAKEGVMLVATSRPQNQTFKPGGNGQDPNQDQ